MNQSRLFDKFRLRTDEHGDTIWRNSLLLECRKWGQGLRVCSSCNPSRQTFRWTWFACSGCTCCGRFGCGEGTDSAGTGYFLFLLEDFSRKRKVRLDLFAIFENLKTQWKNEGRTIFERNRQSDSLAAAKPITKRGIRGLLWWLCVCFCCLCLVYLLVELALVPALVQHQRELCVSYKCREE